jgi:hypothetical protein
MPFKYKAVNQQSGPPQICLLTLERGQENPVICGRLRNVDLHANKGNFEALSYVCGDATQLKTIAINDRPFKIHQNLFNALGYVQHRLKT